MAFYKLRGAICSASFLTVLAAGAAQGQVYSQPAATAAQPRSQATGTYPQYATQPATGAAPATRSGTQPSAYAAQPAYQQPASQYQQPAQYQQPGQYQQPARQPQPAPSAAYGRGANARVAQASGAVTYPEATRPAGAPRSGVRPAQFEQPVDQQQQDPSAAAEAAPASDPPGFRATEVSNTPLPATVPADVAATPGTVEHPLMPALRFAKQGFDRCNNIQDYSCRLVKRERIDGVLGEHEYIFVKVRHKPFSVYTYFLGPPRVKGQEAVFVDGQNDGSLLAHGNGIKHRLIGTVSLKPTSTLAMSGNRYPITEMGIRRLLERLIEIGSNDVKYGECTVNWIQGAKVDNRVCTCIQVVHPYPRRNFLFHLARIYVDDELQLPIRYEAYEWPAPGTTQPQLTEEYSFLNIKLNNGFTDADFSTENPTYGFK